MSCYRAPRSVATPVRTSGRSAASNLAVAKERNEFGDPAPGSRPTSAKSSTHHVFHWQSGRDRDELPGNAQIRGYSTSRPSRPPEGSRNLGHALRQFGFRTALRFRPRAVSFGRQQRLYFRPLPHAHGAPRCVVSCRRRRCPNIRVKTRRTICENRSTRLAIRDASYTSGVCRPFQIGIAWRRTPPQALIGPDAVPLRHTTIQWPPLNR